MNRTGCPTQRFTRSFQTKREKVIPEKIFLDIPGTSGRIKDNMSKIALGEPGTVYCLVNDSMPGLLKIGATTKTARERAKQLSAATAAPTPFVVAYQKPTDDVNAAEAEVHRVLSQYRTNDKREFFEVSVFEACQAIDLVCGGFSRLEPRTPWSELFASFPNDGEARELTPEEKRKCRELARELR